MIQLKRPHPFARHATRFLPWVPYFSRAGFALLAVGWVIIALAALGVGHPSGGHEMGPSYFQWTVFLAVMCGFVVAALTWWPGDPLVGASIATLLSPIWLSELAWFPWESSLALRPFPSLFFFALLLYAGFATRQWRSVSDQIVDPPGKS